MPRKCHVFFWMAPCSKKTCCICDSLWQLQMPISMTILAELIYYSRSLKMLDTHKLSVAFFGLWIFMAVGSEQLTDEKIEKIRASFSYKIVMPSFSYLCTVCLCIFFGKIISAQKLLVKCWWKWLLLSIAPTLNAQIFHTNFLTNPKRN